MLMTGPPWRGFLDPRRRGRFHAKLDTVNRLLIVLGGALILAGLAWPALRRLPLFRLPGDIVIDRPGLRLFFPLTTMLLLSALVSLIAWLLRR